MSFDSIWAEYRKAKKPGDDFDGWLCDEIDRLRAANAGLVEALRKVDRELKVPAAEYVPAIPAAWDIIDAALAVVGVVK